MATFYRKILGSFFFILLCGTTAFAQRGMEYLNRGTIAVPGSGGILVSWRITGPEYGAGASYNLYRGETLIASGLNASNYVDNASNGEGYSVTAVINGVEGEKSKAVAPLSDFFFKIPVRAINGGYDAYNINDASVGDLDGDGDYEIVVKRLANDATPTSTNYHYLEAYEFDGTFLWAINLGPNILNTVEVNFLVYDLDGDGKAEVATRTSDGMIDGTGVNIGDRDGDGKTNYRDRMAQNVSYFRVDGPDYISIFDGETGKEIAWDWYIDMHPISQWGTAGMNESQLGHRLTKCMWSVAYTDGVNPSFVISRGIYHRIKLEAWNFRNGKLTKEWAFDTDPNNVPTDYTGSGFHNFIVGDIDADGRDEVVYGSMAVDEYGKGIYSTKFEHGDAQHLADINPDIPGLEHFSCLEHANGTTIPGLALRNAATGSVQWKFDIAGDIGRSMAADIDPNHKGMEIWGSAGGGIYSATGQLISTTLPTTAGNGATYNFGVWWDGDVQRELLDRTVITKWNAENQWTDRVATLYNLSSISSNNGSKSNPSLMADLLGDWREEIVYPSSDQTGVIVFSTPHVTSQRMYTLMHDPNYRIAIAFQQNSYNQPPNLGFYFGGDMEAPPVPNIKLNKVNEAPSVTLTAPADNGSSRVNESVSLVADAKDDLGIAKVVFYATNAQTMNMVSVGEDLSAPYALQWAPTELGKYYLVAKVTDTHGITTNSNILTYTIQEALPIRFVYEADGSGDLSWENTGSWTPNRLPTDLDTAVIRSGEVQITTDIGCPVLVEEGGIYRSTSGNRVTKQIALLGGTLKVHTSGTDKGMTGPVEVLAPSTVWAGSTPESPFLSDLVFSGNENLTKTNVGILQLQQASPNFGGDWLIREGAIKTMAPGALGSGTVIVEANATLQLNVNSGAVGVDSLILKEGARLSLGAIADTVRYLKLSDELVTMGSYTAMNAPEFIQGEGVLVVLQGPEDITSFQGPEAKGTLAELHWDQNMHRLEIVNGNNASFVLIDANGTLVRTLQTGINDLADLSGGTYFVIEVGASIGAQRNSIKISK